MGSRIGAPMGNKNHFDPSLRKKYVDAFNKSQSFDGASAITKVCPNAVRMYFRRYKIKIKVRKVAS